MTKLEINQAETESRKIGGLEEKIGNIENKLEEVTELIKTKLIKTTVDNLGEKETRLVSIWHNKQKLESIKASPPKSALVIKKHGDVLQNQNKQNKVERSIKDNNLSVSKSYQNKEGDLVLICKDKDTRDELKDLVASADESIAMNTPKEKRSAITIVGL